MSKMERMNGGTPVGFVTELDALEAASVIYLRLWGAGPEAQAKVWTYFSQTLGAAQGRKALHAFEDLCDLCARHGRRPLMRHAIQCKCVGADESCFAHFIATAATGAREDAMLIATLLVRPDMAPMMAGLAAEFGLALTRMQLIAPKDLATPTPPETAPTLH